MGSGASKDRNKKGIANGEGEQQQQQQQAGDEAAQGQVENPVYNDRGTSEQQQRQQEAPTDQQAAESEVTMAEEYVEAVVAKASDFGDNEWVLTICCMTRGGCMNILIQRFSDSHNNYVSE